LGRAGASAGVPTSGKSAIELEQPPKASAAISSTPQATALCCRLADIFKNVPASLSRTR
jgi:hypothetical protein